MAAGHRSVNATLLPWMAFSAGTVQLPSTVHQIVDTPRRRTYAETPTRLTYQDTPTRRTYAEMDRSRT